MPAQTVRFGRGIQNVAGIESCVGDQGPLKFKRTTAVEGLPPPAAKPLADEFELLGKTTAKKLVADAIAMLVRYGVTNPTCGLGADPPVILLGEPRTVLRNGAPIVVSRVLNTNAAGWSNPAVASDKDLGLFGDTSSAAGYYSNDPLRGPVFVHSADDGQSFYDFLTACVIDDGILFNMHSEGAGQSVYHEILHTFEGPTAPMVNSTILKEGFVEYFADIFMKSYGIQLPVYPPYALYVADVKKLIKTAKGGERSAAKAYFGNGDPMALAEFIPAIYKPTKNTLPNIDQITDMCQQQAATCGCFRDLVSPFKLKAKDSWYRKWVADNGGKVPKDGQSLV
jgi:hypothetical protein